MMFHKTYHLPNYNSMMNWHSAFNISLSRCFIIRSIFKQSFLHDQAYATNIFNTYEKVLNVSWLDPLPKI